MGSVAKLPTAEFIEEYFKRCRLAEDRRAREGTAVVTIQAYARGFLVRRRLQRLTSTAVTIQRWWRGYLGRLRGRLALEVHDRALRKRYFSAMATVIQRWWRGYYSRKNIHDYYARKRYLQHVKERNHHVRAELSLEAERAIIMQRQEAEERARKLFADKVSKLHHLVSTSTQPGIFNSPYSIATGTLPVVMGMPLEEHLKSAMKSQLGAQGLAAGGPGSGSGLLPPLRNSSSRKAASASDKRRPGSGADATAGSGTGQRVGDAPVYPAMVEVAGRVVPARHTLRQTAEYDALHRAALLDEKAHRVEMLSQHPHAFATAFGNATRGPTMDVQSNRNLIPFNDPYDPTIGLRGPRFTPTQQRVSSKAFTRYLKAHPMFDKNMAAEAY